MLKLRVYVPETHLEAVKSALFAAGAGRIGDYADCCWQVAGQGQFRPLEGSAPYIGSAGQLETVVEYRVEMLCAERFIDAVLAALREAHPYEEPAWDVTAVRAPGDEESQE
jgi:hypothetical protein